MGLFLNFFIIPMRLSEFNLLFYLLILVNGGRVGVGWGGGCGISTCGVVGRAWFYSFWLVGVCLFWGLVCLLWGCLFVCFVVRLFGFGLLFVLMLGCFGLSHYFGVLLR